MLRITPTQMIAFQKAALQHFEHSMISHIKQFAPRYAEPMDATALAQFIKHGIQRSAVYGMKEQGAVRLFLELMMMLGHGFDTDPLLPWAAEVLTNPLFSDEHVKADFLFHRATDYLQQVLGPNSEYLRQAAQNGLTLRLYDLPQGGPYLDIEMADRLRKLYPARVEFCGDKAIEALVTRTKDIAHRCIPTRADATAVLVSLAFSIGHGFASDPRFPRIKEILESQSLNDGQRVLALFECLRNFLSCQLEDLDRPQDHL